MNTHQLDSLIRIEDLEYPRSITRGIKACLTLAGAAAGGVLAFDGNRSGGHAATIDLLMLPADGETRLSPRAWASRHPYRRN